jgi:purine-nucleoside phosphorylase
MQAIMEVPGAAEREKQINEAFNYITNKLPEKYRKPVIGLICGADITVEPNIEEGIYIPFSEIPHLSIPTDDGMHGKFLFGNLRGVLVVCLLGRFHYYEGYSLQQVVFPIRILAKYEIKNIIVANAAGGLDPLFAEGDFMVIEDHISFLSLGGAHPLRGENMASFGPRFPAMNAYAANSYTIVSEAAAAVCLPANKIQRGTYIGTCGPSYETRAEVRYLTMIGGSAVGMSTVQEVICAAHSGISVIGISVISYMCDRRTNREIEMYPTAEPNRAEVMKSVQSAGADLLCEITRRLFLQEEEIKERERQEAEAKERESQEEIKVTEAVQEGEGGANDEKQGATK